MIYYAVLSSGLPGEETKAAEQEVILHIERERVPSGLVPQGTRPARCEPPAPPHPQQAALEYTSNVKVTKQSHSKASDGGGH